MSASSFPIREVLPEWVTDPRAGDEPMGTKRKFWCQADDGRHLFKYAREGTGEDWAEVVAAEIASVLGVPHAAVELAAFEGERGTLTRDFTEHPQELVLVHGNELLHQHRPDYPRDTDYRASQHTVGAVLHVLGSAHPPLHVQSLPGLSTAAEWFVGYVMLDALIGNTDRHHENWGVIELRGSPDRHVSLAPSYDHASSLGREIGDEERAARLSGGDGRRTIASYARKARSALYRSAEDARPLHPTDAFVEARRLLPGAGDAWLARLERLDDATLSSIVGRLPVERASVDAQKFAIAFVLENRRALLACREAQT